MSQLLQFADVEWETRTCILMLIVKLVGIHDQGINRILIDGDLDTRDASSESFPCF